DNFLFSDEIIANGFHSCDSDEDDRASHASSSDWTPRPRIGRSLYNVLRCCLPLNKHRLVLFLVSLSTVSIQKCGFPYSLYHSKSLIAQYVVLLISDCKNIFQVSVSCGIPDFRSRDGIYARLAVDFPDLPDPQAMFDIEYFRKDPRPFFKFAKEIYPGQFQPSLCHKFIALMDKEGKLLRNYTQNIDTLEQVAGIQRIIQCHGSFATASCLICKYKVDCEVVRGDIFNQVVPRCPRCPPDEPLAIMKPDIVFFGENLPEQFHRAMKYDKNEVDLLIVIGSSLKVRPVALIPKDSSTPERMTPPDALVASSEHPAECKVENCDPASETKGACTEEKLQDTQTSSENPENPTSELMNSETMKENRSNNGENKEKNEIVKKCWVNRAAKEQISKRLDGTQYLFLPPNRYIFHGAEVYSDSEDDIISSSSCGSSSESGSCRSQSLDVEDESEIEEFYNGVEDEDAPEREEEPGFGEDGVEQDESAADESAYTNEAAGTDYPSNKL
ncbi:SIR1 deacetylase, partial [Corythaeola cristata]|nr:SIR1 deacetylase [Corythaeola cristata]